MEKPGLIREVFIGKQSTGRRLVVPDVHGCLKTFQALLQKIQVTKEDQVFLLGDYIDRGPNSSGVIELILDLLSQGFQLHGIRGNHEEMIMDCMMQGAKALYGYAEQYRVLDLLDGTGKKINPRYLDFMSGLPYLIETEGYILVHAGLDFFNKHIDPFENYSEMLWIRDFEVDTDRLGGRKLIHGHTPVYLRQIKTALQENAPVFPLDNGCVFKGWSAGLGNLVCLDLDSRELWVQPNVDR
jgi:serine/threonine protein phosphatase 1